MGKTVKRNEWHVVPMNDIREHVTFDGNCWCKPQAQGTVWVHNSADGREHTYEKGKLQ